MAIVSMSALHHISPFAEESKADRTGGEETMSTVKHILKSLKENYMEYVNLVYGPFDR